MIARAARFAALFAGLAVAGLGLVATLSLRRMTQRRRPDPPADPEALGLQYEDVAFRARDGLLLRGWFLPALGVPEDGPTIVFCHGHSGSMDPDLQYVPSLQQAGFHVLMFDFRAHGRSEGNQVSMGYRERWDLLGAVDHLRDRGIEHIGVLGFSMGGAVAILTAAECPHIRAVATDGAFARFLPALVAGTREAGLPDPLAQLAGRLTQAMAAWRLGLPLEKAQPIREVHRLAPRPLLIIHGGQDIYAPLEEVLALYGAAGWPKTLWLVGEARHRQVDRARPEAYRRRLTEFFQQALDVEGEP